MNYIVPQLTMHQEFLPARAASALPLFSCVLGPKAGLHRSGVVGEEEAVGAYDPATGVALAWPGRAANSEILQDTAEVRVKDALLRYYSGSDFEVPAGQVGGNVIVSPTLILQSKNGSSRATIFGNRDVSVGDKVAVSWDSETVNTQITALGGALGSEVDPAEADADNQANVTAQAPTAVDAIADTDLSTAASGTYDGLADGFVEETYEVVVTTPGAPGTAKASVTSLSGKDDEAEISLPDATAIDIGSRGVKLTITDAASGVFVVGDKITITARQAFTAPTPASGGNYVGGKPTTYIVVITEGGEIGAGTPKFKVTTTNGYDLKNETALVDGANTIGNYGVTITVGSGDQFSKDDAWTIDALPESERPIKTITLAADLVANGNSATDADTLSVDILIQDDVIMDKEYFNTSETLITILPNAAVEDEYLDLDADLPIMSGNMYVEYVETLSGAVELNSLNSVLDVEDELGPIVPSNKLAYGVYKALQNSAGMDVYFVNTPTDDAAGYEAALDRISIEPTIWSITPLTKDSMVLGMVKAFVLEQSNPENNNWKKGWFNSATEQTTSIYTEESGSTLRGTVDDDNGGSNYVNVLVANADFQQAGVVAGDVLRYDPMPSNGQIVWKEAAIASVDGATKLTLSTPGTQITRASDMEIWRTLSLTDYAAKIAADSSAIGERRINNIWPDKLEDENGVEVEGYFLCAALAAYRGSVAPHQPLTRAEVAGFKAPSRSMMFSKAQLNKIASGGTWIITSDTSGKVYTRHQLTTDRTDEETQEDSVTSNVDSISRAYVAEFDDVVGKGNVTPDMLELLEGGMFKTFKGINNLPYPRNLGPQMLGYELLQLAKDPVLKSRVIIRFKPDTPVPLNNLDIFMYIGG